MNKKAFTLIELLVVVLIIGILSAIALPQYIAAVEKARASEALINLKHAQQAYIVKALENPNEWIRPSDLVEMSGGKWNNTGNFYCTKHFFYEFAHPDINVFRSNEIADDCSTSSNDSYWINIEVPPEPGWENFKECKSYNDSGYRVCKSLEGQGFTTIDERE